MRLFVGNVEPNRPELEQQRLYERYLIPNGAPLLDPIFRPNRAEINAAVLEERRTMLEALETEFILSIGLSIGHKSPRGA